MRKFLILSIIIFSFFGSHIAYAVTHSTEEGSVRISELCRLSTTKENALVGYGLVTGLSGTGDSTRSVSTGQSIRNILRRFEVNVPLEDARSRNTAAVMVTATLPAYAQIGNKLDINVTSMGDARSLVGGTLLLSHLVGVDNKIYALAQGPISVGGYSYDLNGNVIQKNHATAAQISGGAIVERSLDDNLVDETGNLEYLLNDPNFDTANKITQALKAKFGNDRVRAVNAARIQVSLNSQQQNDVVNIISEIGRTRIKPDILARVVINERTGTVVAGSDVRISPVTVTHGNLNVAISTEYVVSQPSQFIGGNSGVRTQIVPQTEIKVNEGSGSTVILPKQSTVSELISALNKVHASSRDVITILQGVKRAGALHADLIIQ